MKFLETASLKLVYSVDRPPAEYAILSHAWGHLFGELDSSDVDQLSSATEVDDIPSAWNKCEALQYVVKACYQARVHSIRYLWVFDLCVDKSSSADVAESVTASFRLVWEAALCIVHLPDLLPAETSAEAATILATIAEAEQPMPLAQLENALSPCRWFTRGWTLQELIASRHVQFFDRDWNLRGVKTSKSPRPWLDMLSRVSYVDTRVLADRKSLFNISLGRRISWAAYRTTSRPEDAAYCLMGICGIQGQLTPRYGEGGRSAFLRLQEKILMTTSDLSILAWKKKLAESHGDGGMFRERESVMSGVFANSPADFEHFASRSVWDVPFASETQLTFGNRGLCVQGTLSTSNYQWGSGCAEVLVLNFSQRSRVGSVLIGILLMEIEEGIYVRHNPHEVACFPLRNVNVKPGSICIRRNIDDLTAHYMSTSLNKLRVSAWMDEVPDDMVHTWPSPLQQHNIAGSGTADEALNIGDIDLACESHSRRLFKRGHDKIWEHHDCSCDCFENEHDILLFDSLPEKPDRLSADHHLQYMLHDLVTMGMKAWKDAKSVKVASQSEELTPGVNTVPALRHITNNQSIPLRPKKRARREFSGQYLSKNSNNSVGSCTAETDDENLDVVVIQMKHGLHSSRLTCPFYKLDPVRYHSCLWEIELPDTRTIKQHVIVDHRMPDYCPICYATFDSAASRDRHIVTRCCKPQEPAEGLLHGVTESHVQRLSQPDEAGIGRMKSNGRGRSENREMTTTSTREATTASVEVQKWFRMWDILFPNVRHPESPHVSTPLEGEVLALRSFWQDNGSVLVASEMRKRKVLEIDDPEEENTLTALWASVLQAMMEQYKPEGNRI